MSLIPFALRVSIAHPAISEINQTQANLPPCFSIPRAQMSVPLSSWPCENLGSFKYIVYGPLVSKVIHSRAWEGGKAEDVWCLHLLLLFVLRGFVHQLWWSFSSMLFLTRKRCIITAGIDFKQIDREWDCWAWDASGAHGDELSDGVAIAGCKLNGSLLSWALLCLCFGL